MIPRMARFPLFALLALSIAACEPSTPPAADASLPASQSDTAQPASAESAPAAAAPVAAPEDPVAGLAAVAAAGAAVDAPPVVAYLDRHFGGACSDADERLSFDRVCRHYAADAAKDDPSPWPDLVLGIAAGRIVSVVSTSAAQSPGTGWQCAPAPDFEGMRYCYLPVATEADRKRWSAEWTAYFGSGD